MATTITSLSSSALVAPSFWLSPQNGVNYVVAVQTPISRAASVDDIMTTPRNAQSLVSVSIPREVPFLFHFDGEFASGSQTYAGMGTLRYAW